MLYYLVRPLVRYVLSYYYQRIEIEGLEHIPPDAAVILAANHPTAFIEPCILACYQPRALHFLARGNLYKNGLASATLRALNILPVYRWEDGGYGKLRDNYATFADCYRALSRRRCVMILAEGRCIHEKQLRPLRRGTARIALGALDGDPTLPEVYVVPVGVNFTAADRVRSSVLIRCGAPLRASTYLERYRQAEPATLRAFTDDLRARLSPLVVQLPVADSADAAEVVLTVARNDHRLHRRATSALSTELAAASGAADRTVAARHYASLLHHWSVDDLTVARAAAGQSDRLQWTAVLAPLLLLPQLPLWLLAEWIARRFPGTLEFYSPVRFATVAIGSLFYLPALLLLPWAGKLWLLLSLLCTNWAGTQVQRLLQWAGDRHFRQLPAGARRALTAAREGVGGGVPVV